MGDMDMGAALADYQQMTSETTGTEESGESVTTPSPEAAPTKEQITQYFETMMDGKPMKLPYNLELPLKHNGEMMNIPLEKLANTYRQFEHIQGKHKDFQAQQEAFQKKVGDWKNVEALQEKFGAIQDWSEKNPQEFDRLWQIFNAKDQVLAGAEYNPLVPQIKSLEEKLSKVSQTTEQYEQLLQEKAAQEDTALIDEQIKDTKKEFPFLELDEKDLDGISLQSRIIQHGIQNGDKDFSTALWNYPGLRQKLMNGVRESVKTEQVKQIKSDHKNGIIARNSTQTPVKSGDFNVKRMSPQEKDTRMLEELSKVF